MLREETNAHSKRTMHSAKYKIVVEQHEDGFVAYPLGSAGSVAGQGDTAAGQPLGQRHAEMASTAVGATLEEFRNDRADGHVANMPYRAVVECGEFSP